MGLRKRIIFKTGWTTYVNTAANDAGHVRAVPDPVVAAAVPVVVVHVQVERIKAAADARWNILLQLVGTELFVAPADSSVHDVDLDSFLMR